jgi:hypothetical protein
VNKKKEENNLKNDYPEFRPFPLYALLVCGAVLVFTGLYLIVNNEVATGITLPGRLGTGGSKPININGTSTLIIGFVVCVFPVFQLIKNSKKKN